ncbi:MULTISPECIES: helix-turn-helix domain-containing protein [Paracoccaceae]|uniref:helix-turn-helix domain-containing protein n=1 Tax=Paracoccaceae TaxID=31989 RepID=UPI0015726B46|nr:MULTISPECIES: helix-turn-helix transcriptional regulator [Paracoccaceae]MBJ2153082.1 helix-turn-helix transcriptional regulator [Paracoccus sp. IB05]NTT88219.1 helix-turn-helix transcriptional regulator [Tabrizicola sp. SY72]
MANRFRSIYPINQMSEGMHRDIDIILGEQIRDLRRAQGISLADLGDEVGVSYQQMQKYEAGVNSLSVSKFVQISKLFSQEPSKLLKLTLASPDTRCDPLNRSFVSDQHMCGERSRLREAYFALALKTRLTFLHLLEAVARP